MKPTCGPPLRCFQGVIPAIIATASADATPNVTFLSHVVSIDEHHVALSCQFFNKTKQNVLENPYTTVHLSDPVTYEVWRLELRYLHEETSGGLFDAMSIRIEAIAAHTGMKGIFRLLSADVYRVERCERIDGFIDVPAEAEAAEVTPGKRNELRGLQLVSQATCRAHDLDSLLASVLESLEVAFGFEHAMVLVPDESGARLFTVASRGYGDAGIGAEVDVGVGLIGMVARERRALRLSAVDSALRYGRAVRSRVEQTGGRRDLSPEIPLAGLSDAQSQMALPLVVGERLVGVLALESRAPLGFDDWDEAFLEIVANHAAVGIDNLLLRERDADDPPPPTVAPPVVAPTRVRRFRFFRNDDCVFVDGAYLVRNVPGRILWKVLRAHVDTGRREFTNRELRLDPWLGLPAVRDNLESRLVLLRKRLELKCTDLRLPSIARGHFRIDADCAIELEESDGG